MNFEYEGQVLNKGKNAVSISGLKGFLEGYSNQARSLMYIEEANMVDDLIESLFNKIDEEKKN